MDNAFILLSPVSMAKRLWNKIENRAGYKFPDPLKKLLSCLGFDNEFVLLNITEEVVLDIEKQINEDKSVLRGTKYENRHEFHFDLGDKVSVLSLRAY